MSIIVKNTGSGEFPLIEAGTYAARCYSMIYIGTIKRISMGKEKMEKRIRISWELPTEMREFKKGEGMKPSVISKEYTLSLNEKANLRKILAAWRGQDFTVEELEGFDITKVLGAPCMLTITHEAKEGGGMYANVTNVGKAMKGLAISALINPIVELNYDNFDFKVMENLPDFIQEKIKSSKEYQSMIASLEAEARGQGLDISNMPANMLSDEDEPTF